MMRAIRLLFNAGYISIAVLFVAVALALVGFALLELWGGVNPYETTEVNERLRALIEVVGLLTIAVAALELGQTILEEEVLRQAATSTPTRVRRFLSRFMIVLVVALAIESLVGVFEFLHSDPTYLPHAASIGLTAAALLVAWGVFVHLNRSAEELEPEAMQETKEEDQELAE